MTQQAGRRIALNAPIQGSAADLMKKAMIDIWRGLRGRGLRTKIILQVHDELVFEVPEGETREVEELVRDKMENVYPLIIPLKTHLGWGKSSGQWPRNRARFPQRGKRARFVVCSSLPSVEKPCPLTPHTGFSSTAPRLGN
jgi:hypothetical protein